MPLDKLPYFFELVAISIGSKLIVLIVLAYPANFICYMLKKAQHIDVYDHGVNYNPFKTTKVNND